MTGWGRTDLGWHNWMSATPSAAMGRAPGGLDACTVEGGGQAVPAGPDGDVPRGLRVGLGVGLWGIVRCGWERTPRVGMKCREGNIEPEDAM